MRCRPVGLDRQKALAAKTFANTLQPGVDDSKPRLRELQQPRALSLCQRHDR